MQERTGDNGRKDAFYVGKYCRVCQRYCEIYFFVYDKLNELDKNRKEERELNIRLNVSDEHYEEIEQKLLAAGFVIDDDAEFVLTEQGRFTGHLSVKTKEGEKLKLAIEEIVYIESLGHEVLVHGADGTCYYAYDRLYQLCAVLDNTKFLRVSNCAIIAKAHVKKIKPSISMKFVLVMSDGALVDVTRSYYNNFRVFFQI